MSKKLLLSVAALATVGLISAITLADKHEVLPAPLPTPDNAEKAVFDAPRMTKPGARRNIPLRAPEGGYTAPVTFTPTQEQFDECIVIDNDGDGKSWSCQDGKFRSQYNSSAPIDHWCILPAMNLTAGSYKISYTYECRSYPENFAILLGTSTEPESMTITVMEKLGYRDSDPVTETQTVELPSDGIYHFGLHAFSDANQFDIYISDISISKIDTNLPGIPSVEIESYGLDATVTVTAPANNIGGEPLDAAAVDMTVQLDDTPIAGGEFSVAPGETHTLTVNVGTSGYHTFSATAKVGDLVSEAGKAEHRFSKIQTIPTPVGYVFTPDEDEYSWCTVLNCNEDQQTWVYGDLSSNNLSDKTSEHSFRYNNSWINDADDWIILPAIDGTVGGPHKLTFNVATQWYTEGLEVCMAYEPTVEALSANKIWSDSELMTGNAFVPKEFLFTTEEGKDFYIAFHAISPANHAFLYVQNICVDITDGRAPIEPTLSDVNFDGGDGTISLTMPTLNLSGDVMDPSTVIYSDVTLDGEPYGEPVTGAPGEVKTLTFSDLTLTDHHVTANAYILGENGEKIGNLMTSIDFKCRISASFSYSVPLDLTLNKNSFPNFLIVDANNDANTWTAENEWIQYKYSRTNAADDWLITPAIEITDVSRLYDIALTLRTGSYEEKFSLYLGREQSVEGMTIEVFPETAVNNSEATRMSTLMMLPEPGRYYVGIHCTSEADMLNFYVSRLEVKLTDTTENSPAAVTDLAGDGDPTGAFFADLTFTFPTLTQNGDPIPEETVLTASVTSETETQTVTGKPGEAAQVRVACPEGSSTVTVTIQSENGSSPEASVNVYCGLAKPRSPEVIAMTVSDDNMSVEIAYTAVMETTGQGHPNIENMDYYLWEWDEEDKDWYQCDVTDNLSMTFTLDSGTPLTMVTLGLQASNGLNSFSNMTQVTVVLGTPYELPLTETFADNKINYEPIGVMSNQSDYARPKWSVADPSTKIEGAVSEEGGYALIGADQIWDNSDSYLILPKISTIGKSKVEFEVSTYHHPATCEISLAGIGAGMDEYVLAGEFKEIPEVTEGWKKVTFDLPEELLDRQWVEPRLYIRFPSYTSISMIDSYTIRQGKNVGVEEVTDTAATGTVEGTVGAVRFTGFDGETAVIVNAAGMTVAAPALEGASRSVPLPAGIYVVTVGTDTYKVAVR